ncbi:hypothetical protein PAHAL_7G193400 [Panicum hallii]|uniref:F-box domain-containing protein n=1 Tax=Panicum hallii TaxID=206008 RepID=A0A2S3I8Q1_9POAL|nr:hypothetical protein PAHAL_7G193400 [Panicum hallii]
MHLPTHIVRAGRRRPAADLPEDVHAEILVRLPAESVLRFRSVCKAWHRITSDPRFLTAHARRRPAQVVLYRYLESTGCKNRPLGYAVDIALDVLPVSGEEEAGRRRRLIGYPRFVTTTDPPERWRVDMPVHCLLLDTQWAELPRLPEQTYGAAAGVRVREYGFYFHRPSREFRLLCGAFAGGQTAWCVLSTGAAEPRQHGADDQLVVNQGHLRGATAMAPLALHDRLHWPPRGSATRSGRRRRRWWLSTRCRRSST